MAKKLTHQTNQGERPLNSSPGPDPVKILHVLGRMAAGGVETWLLQVLRRVDRSRFQIDLLVRREGPYDGEAWNLGAKVLYCPYPAAPWAVAANFHHLLREHGPYQIIHNHLPLGDFLLLLAHRRGVPCLIHHCHSDEERMLTSAGPLRRFLLTFSKALTRRYATLGLAVSNRAARWRFGSRWQADSRVRLFPSAIDLEAFQAPMNPAAVRRELGIPENAFIIGHVGRFFEVKNHAFLVEIFAEVSRREPRAVLLLVGDGPLRPAIEQRVAALGLEPRVYFSGVRADVPRLMLGAMDLFLFPSRFEGLAMAVIEAQTAGCPCLLADTISAEADIIPPLVRRLPLSHSASAWADAALAIKGSPASVTREEALARIEHSFFDIRTSVSNLEALYGGLVRGGGGLTG